MIPETFFPLKTCFMHKIIPFFLLTVLITGNCKKDLDELSKLPMPTQEGKRTFGCLINGKAWIPENGGIILTTPPLRFSYENINGGMFGIIAEKDNQNTDQSIIIGIDSCTTVRKYNLSSNNTIRITYNDFRNAVCSRYSSRDSGIVATGFVNITRFDLGNGIISGTFEFSLSQSGCLPLIINGGRFDAKL